MPPKILIGSDHGGFKTKEALKRFLDKKKIAYEDVGTSSDKSIDYPDIAKIVARKVARNKQKKGVLVCGSGTGMAIAANRVKGIRAALIYDTYSAKMSRIDNDANIACLRGRKFSARKATRLLNTWLSTPASTAARHKRRQKKLDTK